MTDIDEQAAPDTIEPASRRAPTRLVVLAIAAVLLLGEAGARVLEPRLPAVDVWGSEDLDEKSEAILELQEVGADVVFLGSSAVNRGFSAEVFTDLTGISAFNAAVDASSPRLMEVYIEEMVEPNLRPRVVVIGLTSRAFNENALTQRELLDRYLASPGRAEHLGSATVKQQLEAFASRTSAFVRLRSVLRQPKQLVDALRGLNSGPVEDPNPPYTIDPNWAAQMANRSLADYEIGSAELTALARIVDDLASQGIEVVLVDLPVVVDDWAALHPDGEANLDEFHEALAAFALEHGVELIDAWDETWPVEQFRDPVHLNAVGQDRLTRLVVDHLSADL